MNNIKKKKKRKTQLKNQSECVKNENNKIYRRAVLSDFIDDTNIKTSNIYLNNIDKAKGYRLQGEYGEKKFIKP
tara:strand:+ start:503 stop:724 length:222 start_codon:yes stop_codon:yes gene_type:complete